MAIPRVSEAARKARVESVVAQLVAEELAEQEGLRTIDDIENQMIAIGDAVAREYGGAVLRHCLQAAPQPPPCPQCGHASEFAGTHRRSLVTRRGPVPTSEPKYRCPKCRQHFFPSVGSVGN